MSSQILDSTHFHDRQGIRFRTLTEQPSSFAGGQEMWKYITAASGMLSIFAKSHCVQKYRITSWIERNMKGNGHKERV